MKLAFYVVAGGVTHNAHPGFTGADLDGIWGQVPQNSDSLTVLLLQLTDGPSNLKWALGAYCVDFALLTSLKTRGYPAANKYNGDP